MVVGGASIHNIMGGMESTGGVRLHNHKRKLKQRFDIIKKLGQGTYGKVQLGINKETGQEVAIKTIKKCKIETEADLIRIRREIQIMSSVQHPNIIHIYEVFENREKMVLVMEYAAGGELYDYLSERKVLTEHEARRIFRQIATAVFYCHKHKICHRDLKLENILLDQVGNAKIADFGLSNVFDEQRLLNTFCGSPLYASPEIVKGTPYHGPEVDCWSLGVLLYTLVYGAMPFDGSNFKRLVKQISQSDYFEPEKPSPASPLIKDMLTVCPGRRADIERICTHWWVNEGYEQNCLDIAEDLAAQTPVRLDLLLSLVPQSASAEKLVVGDQQTGGDVGNNMSSETLVPTRCHSVGSLMELDQNNSDRRIRELLEEPRTSGTGDAKRKLETTPSMDETAAAGVKRKERSRRKERPEDREPRTYKSAPRHHSAPIPNSITEEAMEVEPTISVPTSKTVDLNKIEATAACLELIEECKERSPSKERSKTPIMLDQDQLSKEPSAQSIAKNYEVDNEKHKEELTQNQYAEMGASYYQEPSKSSENLKAPNNVSNDVNLDKQPEEIKSEMSNEPSISSRIEPEPSSSQEMISLEATQREFKKLKEKALSLDSELSNESREVPAKTFERRRSKIFETAEKFNQMASSVESEKPKKIFIPGVNVGGAKRVFERKASLSSITTPPTPKASASKIIIDVPTDKKVEKPGEKVKNQEASEAEDKSKKDEAKKRAVDIITGAIGKPPMQRKVNGSPPTSPQSHDAKKLPLKIPVAPNDVRSATVSVSTPVETKFPFDGKVTDQEATISSASEVPATGNSQTEEPKMSSKMEITLKSATLPRPRKTSKAEISLSSIKSEPVAFKSEVEAKIDAFQPQQLRTQRSEIAFPVAATIPQPNRSSSLEPEGRPRTLGPKERIIPIQVEAGHQHTQHSSTPPPKPPMPQKTVSQRSGSLSRQSTADSDTDSALGSTIGPEPIRKSPREYIIPIAVEGGGYVTPRSGSVEPESKTSTPTSTNAPRSTRFGRPRRMSSLLSDASEDESPFSTLHRDSEDLLQRHMHRLRSSRPSRQAPEHADSLSSGEDDDDDGFELLTAENLFSTLLSRVRSLTQRLNVDDNRSTGFPSSRLFGRLGSNSPQAFWGLNKPLSRRLTESQFKHSLSREGDLFSRKDSANSSIPGTPNSPGSHSTPSRESVFEIGSNTLPRDKVEHEDIEAEAQQVRKETQESLEQSFTPSLARRLSRQFIEQTRQSLPRSPSIPYEKYYQSPTRETLSLIDSSEIRDHPTSTTSDQTEYKGRSADRHIRRTNSLLEPGTKTDRLHRRSPRRSISLFEDDDEDRMLPPYPRQVMTLGRKYKEKSTSGNLRGYKTDKIQEESTDDTLNFWKENPDNVENNVDNGSISECTSASICNSTTNLMDTTSSVSVKSYETSPTESSSNIIDYKSAYKSDLSKNFENRLLAAENLIKESKLRNLGPPKFNPNLSTSYKDTDKCDKESLVSMADTSSLISKRRSCIPSLRLRSGSLTREPSLSTDRRKSFTGSQDALGTRGFSPEKSLLSKFFKTGNSSSKETESKTEKPQKPRQHRISRFLRPDFFDTPREESQYVKEKEAQKAAENERRKSRFIKRKNENKIAQQQDSSSTDEKREKELKNEINSLKKDRSDVRLEEKVKEDLPNEVQVGKVERQGSKSSFLQTLEKKLEKLRSGDDAAKPIANGGVVSDQKVQNIRENSAPPAESSSSESCVVKRAISVEDLSLNKTNQTPPKSRVSSVLGLFKNSDTKTTNGRQSTLLSKLKKSPPKCTKNEASPSEEVPSTSRIPTKFTKSDPKLVKKATEMKKSEIKRSPPKEKVKEKVLITKDKKALNEKQSKETKKVVEKSILPEVQSITDAPTVKSKVEKEDSLEKVEDRETAPEEAVSKIVDNNQTESTSQTEDKKLLKTKKNSSLVKSSSTTDTDKREDSDKKVKKVIKSKDGVEKEDDATKKKKIVRVVKKVVKKSSDSSESKSEEKVKPKVQVKKKIPAKNEKSPEPSNSIAIRKTRSKENNLDTSTTKSSGRSSLTDTKSTSKVETTPSTRTEQSTEDSGVQLSTKSKTNVSTDSASVKPDLKVSATDLVKPVEEVVNLDAKSAQSKLSEQRASRSSLKLDLSKIPQHTFRNTTPKKESPKSDSPKATTSVESPKASNDNVPEKLMECLSKMTHHANIAGNKIVIDKPLRAKDVAELKREVTECARIIESSMSRVPTEDIAREARSEDKPAKETITETPAVPEAAENTESSKESPNDFTNELFSPVDEPESFDSWSLSSADFNHTRPELHSPTSPSHPLFSRTMDQSESVIDRIRRRSFYSRFNDRKRPSLTAPPPGVTLPTSSTLPRKFSFSSFRERDRNKYGSYGTSKSGRHADRNYSLYGDDGPKRSMSRDRYSELTSTSPYINDLKSPSDHYSSLSSSYDPLRRYLRSPTFDLSSTRSRYHSADFSADSDHGSYRTPLSSLLNDGAAETHSSTSSTLPKKYGASTEPKTVEYYEELLAPSNPDYLATRKTSPLPSDYHLSSRCENGYHNGNLDLHLATGRRKSYADRVTSAELAEASDGDLGEQKRTKSDRASETKNLPSTSTETSNACTAD